MKGQKCLYELIPGDFSLEVRNLIYTVKAYPDFTLNVRFVQQTKEIASAVENNQSRNADYLSEKMVLDYGTHVITSVDAGAALVQEDYLSSSYVSDSTSDNSSIKAQAGLNFFDKLKFDISSQSAQQSSSLQTYRSKIRYSLIQSHGGIPFYPGITLQKWQESTKNNLVAIDRAGLPLHYFINTNTLPDLPQPTIEKVALSVSQAIERYYMINMRSGCVDVTSKNFNFQANVDDSSCEGPATNLSFGGVYQECVPISSDADPLCDTLAEKNLDTGDFSCSPPYIPTLLRSEERQQGYTTHDCHEEIYICELFVGIDCTRQVCEDNYHVRSAIINTYWCSVNGEAPENSGYLFGGIYSPSLLNPLTNAQSCPQNLIPVKFLSDGQVICLSKDYEAGSRFAVPFGGLFSCQTSNPLANFQHRCPPKFSQHLASVSDGCEILYCVQSEAFIEGELLPVHLPPFTKRPLVSMHATNTVMLMTEGYKGWVRIGQTNSWKVVKPEEIKEIMQKRNHKLNEKSSRKKALVAFGVIGMMLLLVVGAVVLVKRRRKLSGFRAARGDEDTHGEVKQQEDESDIAR
ncbi:macrophage-expressed gene 1 protein-like [Cheilinus undulatus]|uniref:macrophage-expressed gene 1 protein-like n=1 Tax=Cheilinus undulatus TaxID=241271 RepID=UPI001BD40CD4|nr:macrophage-expressed gene 1 protein-like [Cheilinus undulatus]